MNKSSSILRIDLICVAITIMLGSFDLQAQIIESGSYSIRPETIPSLPNAGSEFIDPVFNDTVLRVTDGNFPAGSQNCGSAYGYVSAFNKNSTKLYVYCNLPPNTGLSKAVIFNFDPVNFTASNPVSIASTGCQEYWMWWSRTDPDLMYCNSNSVLYSYKPSTNSYAVVHDFSGQMSGGNNTLNQMYVSADDNVFTWFTTGGSKGLIAWKKSTNTFLFNQSWSSCDESYLDKTGRYLISGGGNADNDIWDLQSGTPVLIYHTSGLGGGGGWFHHDQGNGTLFGSTPDTNNLAYRNLSNPRSYISLLSTAGGSNPWSYGNQQDHFSMTGEDNNWALSCRLSTEGRVTVSKPFDNECVLIKTDGSGNVRRLGHTYIYYDGQYLNQDFGNLSPDGRFVMWNSNLGVNGGRRDVYVRKINPTPVGTTVPVSPRAPAGLRVI